MTIFFRSVLLLLFLSTAHFTYANDVNDMINKSPYSEIRTGILFHDMGHLFEHCKEEGADVNLELLFTSPDNQVFDFLLSPRPHIGTSINMSGGTHQFYAGLTWHLDLLDLFFLEASFGGETHTGKINRSKATKKHKSMGSRFLFRESVSVGFNFNAHSNLSMILDHASNASLGTCNPGLTALGLRYGYKL